MTRRLKIATAGTGYFSQFHFDAWSRIENVDLVGVCTLKDRMSHNVSERFDTVVIWRDLSEMLDAVEPDLLDIVTPPSTHLQFIKAAVERGVAVVCQKPFTECIAEAKEATALAGSPVCHLSSTKIFVSSHGIARCEKFSTKERSARSTRCHSECARVMGRARKLTSTGSLIFRLWNAFWCMRRRSISLMYFATYWGKLSGFTRT